MSARYRIRPCEGNRRAWLLIRLRDDGSEIDSWGGYITAMSIDQLMERSHLLAVPPSARIELVGRP